MRHLYSNQCHDEAEVWCGKPDYFTDGEPVRNPVDAECIPCLVVLRELGFAAAARIGALRERAGRKTEAL